MAHFPMINNKNGTIPQSWIAWVEDNYGESYYYFIGYYYPTGNGYDGGPWMPLYLQPKTKGEFYATTSGDEFTLYKTGDNIGCIVGGVSYYLNSMHYTTIQGDISYPWFRNLTSSEVDSSKDYYTNFKMRLASDHSVSILEPPPAPVVNPGKYMSAQLNLLRRRLIKLVMPPAYENFFNYTIEEGKAWVTSVKRDEWLAAFGNLDIYIPDTLDGYPVVIVTDMWDW